MKKFPVNRNYLTVSIYAFLVIVASAACILCMTHYPTVHSTVKGALSILSPFIFGGCRAYILNPVLKTCEKILAKLSGGKLGRRASRLIGMFMTYTFMLAILTMLIQIIIPQIVTSIKNLIPQITAWINTLPTAVQQLANTYQFDLSQVNDLINSLDIQQVWSNASQAITSFISNLSSLIPQLFQITTSVISIVVNILIGFIISIYLLSSKELFYAHMKKLGYAILPKKLMDKLLDITYSSNDIFSGFIVGKIVDSAIIGVLCFLVMSIFKWPYAMLISVIIGITNIIPYFGPFIGAIPSILLLLILDPRTAVIFTVFIIILQQVDGNIIGPKILGNSTGLSAFWVVFSITVFSALFGPIGMIIGVPTFAVIYSLVREFAEWRLTARQMPTATDAYASPEHPIIHKEATPPHPGELPAHHAHHERSVPSESESESSSDSSEKAK